MISPKSGIPVWKVRWAPSQDVHSRHRPVYSRSTIHVLVDYPAGQGVLVTPLVLWESIVLRKLGCAVNDDWDVTESGTSGSWTLKLWQCI